MSTSAREVAEFQKEKLLFLWRFYQSYLEKKDFAYTFISKFINMHRRQQKKKETIIKEKQGPLKDRFMG